MATPHVLQGLYQIRVTLFQSPFKLPSRDILELFVGHHETWVLCLEPRVSRGKNHPTVPSSRKKRKIVIVVVVVPISSIWHLHGMFWNMEQLLPSSFFFLALVQPHVYPLA